MGLKMGMRVRALQKPLKSLLAQTGWLYSWGGGGEDELPLPFPPLAILVGSISHHYHRHI